MSISELHHLEEAYFVMYEHMSIGLRREGGASILELEVL
jgi:hypothetical protein